MKWVIFVLMFFISVSVVSGWGVRQEAPLCGCTSIDFNPTESNYDYCIIGDPCIQSFSLTSPLSNHILTSGWGPSAEPIYKFSAPNNCTTPGGCVSPTHLVASDEWATVTIPANPYTEEFGFLGWSGGCGGGGCGETVGVMWYNINPLGEMVDETPNCMSNEPCHIITKRQGRLFHGPVAVKAVQQSGPTWYEDTLNPSSIVVHVDGETYGYIEFDIPPNTFNSGEVSFQVYDLIDTIPVSVQTGGPGTIRYSSPDLTLQIDITQSNCLLSEPCDLDINVLNVPIDIDNQQFEISGQYGDSLFRLTDPEVSVYTNHIEYTIPAYFFEEELVTILYWDSLLSQQDTDVVNMVSYGSCTPTGCDGTCPPYCSVLDDPDCGCADDNGCCPAGCTIANDNDCSVCVPTGCDGTCPAGCSVVDDPDCGCADDAFGCCPSGLGCTIANDADCAAGTCNYNNSADPGEECDGSDLNGNDCTDFGSDDPNGLNCIDCTFDDSSCDLGSGSSSDPVVGPDEYLVNGVCIDDGDGDQYGVKEWTMYNEYGIEVSSGNNTGCVLDIEEIPMFGFWSLLLFLAVLVLFYSRRK
jgi:hypothetical protein